MSAASSVGMNSPRGSNQGSQPDRIDHNGKYDSNKHKPVNITELVGRVDLNSRNIEGLLQNIDAIWHNLRYLQGQVNGNNGYWQLPYSPDYDSSRQEYGSGYSSRAQSPANIVPQHPSLVEHNFLEGEVEEVKVSLATFNARLTEAETGLNKLKGGCTVEEHNPLKEQVAKIRAAHAQEIGDLKRELRGVHSRLTEEENGRNNLKEKCGVLSKELVAIRAKLTAEYGRTEARLSNVEAFVVNTVGSGFDPNAVHSRLERVEAVLKDRLAADLTRTGKNGKR